eukprot:scaffold172435_cov37-Tisochrysis_lutea.AAC.1
MVAVIPMPIRTGTAHHLHSSSRCSRREIRRHDRWVVVLVIVTTKDIVTESRILEAPFGRLIRFHQGRIMASEKLG